MKFEAYPFEKLALLLQDTKQENDLELFDLTIGEPQFETPKIIQDALKANTASLRKYPKSSGESFLKDAQAAFIKNRFGVDILQKGDLLPTFGTREVLFNFPQFLLSGVKNPKMAFPNPFYQIYEGAAIAAGAKVYHLNLEAKNGFKPLLDKKILKKCDLVILNSPNNPTGATMNLEELALWVEASQKYGFVLLNDECYSEIYSDTPPPSILEASIKCGNEDFKNILALNSISKRSSAPGLRSGFIAGDKNILKEYLRYRTYVGCASPLPLQHAAAAAWSDTAHTKKSKNEYKKNLKSAREILGVDIAPDTFYVWLHVGDELEFTKKAFAKLGVKVLPGSYLGREGIGKGYVRLALVYENKKCVEALHRLKEIL